MKHFVAIAFALIAYFLVIGVKSAPYAQIPHNSQDVNEGDNSGSANSSNQSVFPPGQVFKLENCVRRVDSSLDAQFLSFRNDSDTKVSCSHLKEHLKNAKNCPNSEAEAREELVSEINGYVLFFCSEKKMDLCTGPGWFTRIFDFFGF
ncbi:hypothetical protein Ddc_14044 [Ditylenchus destructor]|nr:hypothetical protein Ddc_14044 [Ditylenchus destructor]